MTHKGVVLKNILHTSNDLVVEHMVTGPNTNCYLVYDPQSKQALLIDVAGTIEPLLDTVRSQGLTICYFLFTHSHLDHLMGLPLLRDHFSDAIVCMHRADFNDMSTRREWVLANLDPKLLE